ncbi:MAG: AraC family transcriptional regulator [Firmicutes bacterium]|nr:AraC family transcriptional regulator [Bacillota bacterium]
MSDSIQKTDYMKDLLLHIEENMSNDLEAELLSSIGYVSRRKLYYDFYSISGHSVKEYVRKRRLSNALALIKTSDMGLTDIAFKCGYSSHQALCRVVKQMLNLTPSEYKSSDTYYFFPPFNNEPLQSVTVSSETIPSSLRVLFYHSSLTDIENIAVSTFLRVFPNYEWRIFGRNGTQKGNKFCYELYLTGNKHNYDMLTSHGFEIAESIPCLTSMFASSTVINDEGRINSAWNFCVINSYK